MKNSENLRLIVRMRQGYLRACDLLLRTLFRFPNQPHVANANMPIASVAKTDTDTKTVQRTMSPSVIAASVAAGFTLVTAIAGIIALTLSWKEGEAKDTALEKYKTTSNEKIALLNTNAESLKADAERSRAEIAASNQRALEAQLELEKIRAKLAWREITPEQHTMFLRLLDGVPRGKVQMVSSAHDPEAVAFCDKVKNLLVKSGFEVDDFVVQNIVVGPTPRGMAVAIKDINRQPAHAAALQNAFIKVGIQCDGRLYPLADDNTAGVCVGTKP